ncbi:MAG TPA: hypothetical protein VNH22_02780 [Blastocatellia bacterium]|jgi:hypothetical protein|nr:hypothetical protein [Blastocatellia bacterium]
MNIMRSIKKALIKRAIKRTLTRRVLRPLPIIGTGAVVALALGTIRRKGGLRGTADVALDLIPIVGITKTVIEAFRGDFIPDKKNTARLR